MLRSISSVFFIVFALFVTTNVSLAEEMTQEGVCKDIVAPTHTPPETFVVDNSDLNSDIKNSNELSSHVVNPEDRFYDDRWKGEHSVQHIAGDCP